MKSLLSRLARLSPFGRRRPVGYDLDGNRYYEVPGVNGGRTKRTVEYRIERDISEYTSGQKLPVQWTSWMSHTRAHPPTVEELEKDEQRRARLSPLVQAIEAREQAERIRQGYLEAPPSGKPLQIASQRHSAMPPAPSNTVQSEVAALTRSPWPQTSYPEASSGSEATTPPRKPMDAQSGEAPTSQEELRKLAEADTKRRLQQMEVEPPKPEVASQEGVEGWAPAPRRRGA